MTQKEKEGGIRAYPPLMTTFLNSKHGAKFGKLRFYESLRKYISYLIIGWTILHFKNTIMNELSDEVYVEFNVFRTLMLNWIFT